MDDRLTVLKLFVQELGEQGDINDFESRKRFQKTVYLGQLCGVDLGYRYGWYIKGPYSTSLTQDYYALSDAVARGDTGYQQKTLHQDVRAKLANVRAVLDHAHGLPLDKASWLELLASWHYLNSVSRKTRAEATAVMTAQKSHLAPFIDTADQVLRQRQLLS